MLQLIRLPAGFTSPMNLGNPTESAVLKLAEVTVGMTNSISQVVFKPLLPADDPQSRRPDVNLATARLGWKPQAVLQDGMAKTIHCFDEPLSA